MSATFQTKRSGGSPTAFLTCLGGSPSEGSLKKRPSPTASPPTRHDKSGFARPHPVPGFQRELLYEEPGFNE